MSRAVNVILTLSVDGGQDALMARCMNRHVKLRFLTETCDQQCRRAALVFVLHHADVPLDASPIGSDGIGPRVHGPSGDYTSPFLSGTSLPDLPEAEYVTESGGGDGLSSDPCVNPNPYQDPTSKKEKRHFLKMPARVARRDAKAGFKTCLFSQTWISPQVTCQRQTGDFGARDWLWLSLCAPE